MMRERYKNIDKESEESIWYGLVVPEGKTFPTFPCDEGTLVLQTN